MLIVRGDSVHEEKNDYDYIAIQTSTNDVWNLSTDEIVKDMENYLGKLKNRWPDARIGLSGLTYAPQEEAKNTLIDEINCFYESICSTLDLIYIDNKKVMRYKWKFKWSSILWCCPSKKQNRHQTTCNEHQTPPRTARQKLWQAANIPRCKKKSTRDLSPSWTANFQPLSE